MKLKLDFKSIKFKMWTYFMLFGALILITLWFLQIIFLKSYYQSMKTREIFKAANTLINEYGKKDFDNVLSQYSFQHNMSILITDINGNLLYSSDIFKGDMPDNRQNWGPSKAFGRLSITDYIRIHNQLMQSKDGRVHYKIKSPISKMQILVYGAIINSDMENGAILYITSPLDPIDSTTAILKNQLIIVTFILLLLAFILSFFISRKLSKPIEKLTDSAKLLAGGNYNVIFEQGSYSEVTELSNTLNYATRELSKTDQLRKDLIANISHDLRTPLTMVKMYAEMIRDLSGNNPKKRGEHIDVIINETDRLSDLVKDILDLSKIESGTSKIHYEHFDISQLVKSIITRFKVLSERDGYIFDIDCDDGINVKADEKRIEQVIYNLISNAVNYTGDDKKVTIHLKSLKNKIRFEVIDTGKGIPKEKLENIWERYYKANETHKRAVIGTGLGLSIVKNILEAHNAHFGVNSIIGQGSTFWFELNN